jgi:hypothetical protein
MVSVLGKDGHHNCTSYIHHQGERLLLQVSNSSDLWQSNQRAQGMGHNEERERSFLTIKK